MTKRERAMSSRKSLVVSIYLIGLCFMLASCGGGGGDYTEYENPAPTYYAIRGTVSGFNGGIFILEEGGQSLSITGNGPFNSEVREDGTAYNVIVTYQPDPRPKQSCTVNNGMGTISGSDVTNISVTCSVNAYPVGGTATGLTGSLVLRNNGGDDLTVTSDGSFAFSTPLEDTASYRVTVQSEPAG